LRGYHTIHCRQFRSMGSHYVWHFEFRARSDLFKVGVHVVRALPFSLWRMALCCGVALYTSVEFLARGPNSPAHHKGAPHCRWLTVVWYGGVLCVFGVFRLCALRFFPKSECASFGGVPYCQWVCFRDVGSHCVQNVKGARTPEFPSMECA
jgi:hypothetical protein